MQLGIFITVQILAYFYTEYLYNFFTSKGGGQAQGPPKYAPADITKCRLVSLQVYATALL